MSKIRLTDEEKEMIVKCIEEETEIPNDLLLKLNPNFFDKIKSQSNFDFKTLDKFKIPTIEYEGKRSESVILAQAVLTGAAVPLQVIRKFGDSKDNEWRNMIVQGDNLQFLKTCYMNQDPLIKDKVKGKVKLIYIDPPFATKSDFGGKDGEYSYSDKIDRAEFLETLRERLIYLKELLADDGSIFVHLDYRTLHYIKIIIDEVFGKENLINEIVYSYRIQGISRSSYARKHQTILWYSKTKQYKFNIERERMIYKNPFIDTKIDDNGKTIKNLSEIQKIDIIKYITDSDGEKLPDKYKKFLFNTYYSEVIVRDVWDCDYTKPFISGSKEYLSYPTQKSETLLKRILNNHSEKHDLVIDIFGGSGTTAAVAEKLGRRWITCDFGKHSIYTIQKRIWNIAASKNLEDSKNGNYNKPPKPFDVVSAGAYDFTKIMNLRKNKEAYIKFVTALFGITREENINYEKKYKISNVFAEKNNNPVEVYPVWDDEYLKNIRIDEEYLKDIIYQSGGKLKGDYYIISPVTCALIDDCVLNNSNKDDVNFKFLKFPYKVLEEVSRQFNIEEQPDSSANINKLVSSVGFYFNQNVKIEVKKISNGIEITDFKTDILQNGKEKYKGLEGLSMLLIDDNYDGKVFNMSSAVYSKDIKDNKIKYTGLTSKTHIIAIDKHGNESKITKIN